MERKDLLYKVAIGAIMILLISSVGCINPPSSIQITADDTTPHYRQIVHLSANINNANGAVQYKWDFNNDGVNDTDWSIKNTRTVVFEGSGIQTIKCYAYDNIKNYSGTLSLTKSSASPDFGTHKVIVFESDDWGLQAWVPDIDAYENISKKEWFADLCKDPDLRRYTPSTLEDETYLRNLFDILLNHKGGDGRHVVFQPNYIMGNPNFTAIRDNNFTKYVDIPLNVGYSPRWQRKGVITKAKEGYELGIWYPELHDRSHLNYKRWLSDLRNNNQDTLDSYENEMRITGNGMVIGCEFPSEMNYSEAKDNTLIAIDRFESVFGYKPHSIIAPNYCWSKQHEKAWRDSGISIVQAKKSFIKELCRFRIPFYMPNMNYLKRNCHFEVADGNEDEWKDTYKQIVTIWSKDEPAIVSTHRVNFVTLNSSALSNNLNQLDALLTEIEVTHPTAVYITDFELFELKTNGSSVLAYGNEIVCRNYISNVTMQFNVTIPSGCTFDGVYKRNTTFINATQKGDQIVLFNVSEGDYIVRIREAS